MLRYLRIAMSVLCLLTSVLLFALCVRSYWQFDQLIRRISTLSYVAITSAQGTIAFGKSNDPTLQVFTQKWTRRRHAMRDSDAAMHGPVAFFPASNSNPPGSKLVPVPRFSRHPFVVAPGTTYYELILPYWLLVVSAVSFAALLIKHRFSLRTLTIAMSLIALLFALAEIS